MPPGFIFPTLAASFSVSVGSWTGYEARVQYRPVPQDQTQNMAWPGGYLVDGTFIQNGLIQLDHSDGSGVLIFDILGDPWETQHWGSLGRWPWGSWFTFRASLDGGWWTFTVTGPDGIERVQSRRHHPSPLGLFMVAGEAVTQTDPAVGPFATQAFRALRVRDASGTWLTPRMCFASTFTGATALSRTRGSVVLRWVPGAEQPYALLW